MYPDDPGTPDRIIPGLRWEPPSRKPIRLPHEWYTRSGQHFLITICTYRRRPLFRSSRLAQPVFACLLAGRLFTEAEPRAACLMPDHLHLVVAPREVSLLELIRVWKGYSTHLAKQLGLQGLLWQRSFYDHATRTEEGLAEAGEYVMSDPVRSGLTQTWHEYPYTWTAWGPE